jgi:uncharacterized RDD family membrane protein YckC
MESGAQPPQQQPAPEQPPGGYPGPVPPGGWQQPLPQQPQVWTGAPLAGWGPRVGATLLDAVVMLAAVIALFAPGVILLAVDATAAGVALLILGGLGYLAVYVFYGAYFMQRPDEHNGQTLGKQWVGIRVVRDNSQPFDLGSGLVREFAVKNLLFGWLGGFFFGIPWLIDVLWPLWDDQNRALHDMIVKSHVVQA